MKMVIRFSAKQEAKALPILLRHSPGMVLPNRTYILGMDAVQKLRAEGIKFQEISREVEAVEVDGGASPVKEFDLFVPLYHNDGTLIPGSLFQVLQEKLLEHFEGLTFFPQPSKGFWKMGDVVFQDEIVIYRVVTNKPKQSRRLLSKLKRWMEKNFDQEKILIVERTIKTID